MPQFRTALPAELKELIALIRQGRLFEVQTWIQKGKTIRLPKEGNFNLTPLLAAVRTGFHSMVKVLLDALAQEEDLDHLLHEAVEMARLDLIQLLHGYGADPKTIPYDCVASSHNPLILRWFEDHGVDLETDNPLAHAFRRKLRGSLGTYMRWKDRKPSLQIQAAMALRFHAGKGDLKWVSLLLWANADPRILVPQLDSDYPEENEGSALQAAASGGHLEVLKKFKVCREDAAQLRDNGWSQNPEVVALLLSLGINPNTDSEDSAVRTYVLRLGWILEGSFPYRSDPTTVTDILCQFAAQGIQWCPRDNGDFRYLRKGLSKADRHVSIGVLSKLVSAGFFSEHNFKELVTTPRMKEVLALGYPGASRLREPEGTALLVFPRSFLRKKQSLLSEFRL